MGQKGKFSRRDAEKKYSSMEQMAQTWVTPWKDFSAYCNPTRGHFQDLAPTGENPDHKKLLNGHATKSIRTMAAFMTSGLTSPARPWFKIGFSNLRLMNQPGVKQWLTDVQSEIMGSFSRSGVYGTLFNLYEELSTFGTAAILLVEDMERGGVNAFDFTMGDYFLGTSNTGRVNSFARRYWLTADQAIEEFGAENCSENINRCAERNDVKTTFKIVHLIMPNKHQAYGKLGNLNMPFVSLYWEAASKETEFLRVSGYEEFPVLAPRWRTTSASDVYGRGPSSDAIGDIKMLQKIENDLLMALAKVANPPVQVDATVTGDANLLPGGITRSNSTNPNAGVKAAYQVNPDLNSITAKLLQVEKKIDEWFYSDMFTMFSNMDRRQVTATEVQAKDAERLLLLGPVLERLEEELLDPLIQRTFNILLRQGKIPEPPRSIQGQDYKVEYISMLSQAQKMTGITAVQQFMQYVGSVAPMSQGVIDVVNFENSVRDVGDMLGVAPDIIREAQDVAMIQKQRADAQAAQQQAADNMALVQSGKTLAETPIGGNSALDALMGTSGMGGRA